MIQKPKTQTEQKPKKKTHNNNNNNTTEHSFAQQTTD